MSGIKTKISIIIPIYNAQKYLEECLNSFINQTLKDIEIICVNDGSNDNSKEILDKYSKQDNRIKVIHKENEGAGSARNIGLNLALGEYVLFFDADDFIETTALEKMYENISKNNCDILICKSCEFIGGTKNYTPIEYSIDYQIIKNKKIFNPKEISDYIFQFCMGWPWDKLYKKEFILKNNLSFQNLRQSNDTKFVLSSLTCAEEISILDDFLVYHRKHNNSLESTRTKAPECFYWALIELKNFLSKNNSYEQFEKSFVNYCVSFSLWHLETINNGACEKIMIKKTKELLKEINFKKFKKTDFYNKKHYNRIKRKAVNLIDIDKIFSIKGKFINQKKVKILTILGMKFEL